MNIFRKIRASLRLSEAIRKADKAHRETGERYYVMPNGDNGNLIVMDRSNFRKLKQKGYVSRKAKVLNLEYECFYCTPYSNGTGALSTQVLKFKRKQYFSLLMLTHHQPQKTNDSEI